MISGSSLERVALCPASEVMPHANRTTEASIKGADNHDKIAVSVNLKTGIPDLPPIVQRVLASSKSTMVEISYIIHTDTNRVTRLPGWNLGRDYGPLGQCDIPLTVDMVSVNEKGWSVIDWKSRQRVTPAAKNMQLLASCVAVMATEGISSIHGCIGYLDDGEVDHVLYGKEAIAPFFDRMRKLLGKVSALRMVSESKLRTDMELPVHSGAHCKYCPAIASCPAHTRLAKAMLGELEQVRSYVDTMSPEGAGKAWALLQKIKDISERVEESLRLRLEAEGSLPLPDGKVLTLADRSRKSFSGAKAKERLKLLGQKLEEFETTTHYKQVVTKEVTTKESKETT